jgi:hypothetical protein
MDPLKIIAAFVIFALLLAVAVAALRILFKVPLWFISSLSGWHELAARYPEMEVDPDAKKYSFCTVRLKSIGYGSCVSVFLSSKNIRLRMHWPFRDFHPSICIPRSQLRRGTGTTRWLTEFKIVGEETSIWFTRGVARELIHLPTD